jgi:very-short-patch-repair endonuclease
VNLWVDGYEVDFHWPDLMLIAETDGDQTHGSPWARRNDTHRDRRLRLKGWDVLRFSHREVFDEPGVVVAELRAARYQLARWASPSA